MSEKDKKEQRDLIEELVETRARGVVAGIVGREWCERCGKLGSFSGGCGREVILEERAVEEARRLPFACPACAGFDRGKEARRRYLEHEARRPGGLDEASHRIRCAKAGIEAMLDDEGDAEH